ncbi:helix-turn-helix transcriptional regulator [Streptomyces sp. enrichment culture]|uniref:helix-turn-helix transcriptional regulator n=1 Tax=Streptomyces sp. enrichment culture TaxID=1795815 RepID=UPI003F548987
MRQWAVHSGFDPRRCDQLTDRWAGEDITSFHVAHDLDGTLVRGLGFTIHGGIRDDFYRCGRPPEVSSHDFAPDQLPLWLGRLADRPRHSTAAPLPGPRLAPRELQILLDHTSGMTLKSAARRAGVTPNTAKHYLNRVKAKYRLAGRPAYTKIDLAQRVREDGLLGSADRTR